jgi:hypothetical protein
MGYYISYTMNFIRYFIVSLFIYQASVGKFYVDGLQSEIVKSSMVEEIRFSSISSISGGVEKVDMETWFKETMTNFSAKINDLMQTFDQLNNEMSQLEKYALSSKNIYS